MKYVSVLKTGIVLFSLFSVNHANAVWTAEIDQFNIDLNGTTVVNEDFNDYYLTSAYNLNFPLTNVDGSGQIYSQTEGTLGFSAITGNERWFQRARNLTWLGANDTFLVSSVFDIVTPDASGRYGIRLTDQCGTCANDDVVDLGLRFSEDGLVDVAYRYNNDVRDPALANGFDFAQSTGHLDITAFTQVSFFLRNDGDGVIDAGFLFLDSSTSFDLASLYDSINWFDNGYSMFNGENRVRAEFYNTEIVSRTAVPEPSTLLLFTAGLLGFGVVRRRKV